MAAEPDYPEVMRAIAREIEALKPEFPQLKEFSVAGSLRLESLAVSYGYHTHQPRRRPGWAGAVPNPNPDGIWFYIDLHDPSSQAQIHTQPFVLPVLWIGEKKVTFLVLEGAKTKPLGGRLNAILAKHGAAPRTGPHSE